VAVIFSNAVNTDIVSRFYIQYGGSAPSSADLNAFCSDIKDAWVGQFSSSLNEALTLGRVHAIDLSSTTSGEGDWLGDEQGTATDPPNAADVALVVSYEIDRRYRGGHPRGYWPIGQSTSLSTPQLWSSADVAAWQTAFETFFANVESAEWSGAGGLQHCNVSYYHGFTVITDPITGRARNLPTLRDAPLIDAVSSIVARRHIGTQRRRLQY